MGLTAFRVTLWDNTGTGRGRGSKTAVIDDAKDIGVSDFANDVGEFFMTLPANHPQTGAIEPWLTHYEVSRKNSSGTYDPIGVGLLDDYTHTENEIVVYGRNYLSIFDIVITGQSTKYTSEHIGDILTTEISSSIRTGTTDILGFVDLGTIDTTSKTTTVLTSFEPKLHFFQGLTQVLQDGGTTRPILSVNRSSPFEVTFDQNQGTDKENVRLEYGGNVNNFRYDPGFDNYRTAIYAIGQKRDGAAILYSKQTNSNDTTYGAIQEATVLIDVVDQTALDNRTKTILKQSQNAERVALGISSGRVVPWSGFDLGDSVRVVIKRGLVDVNALYTVWGLEWIGHKDGHEDLFLDLLPKLT